MLFYIFGAGAQTKSIKSFIIEKTDLRNNRLDDSDKTQQAQSMNAALSEGFDLYAVQKIQ